MAKKEEPKAWTDKLYSGVNKPKSAIQSQIDEMEATQPKMREKPPQTKKGK